MDNKTNKQLNAEMSSALFSDTERFEMLFAAHWKKVAVIGVGVAILIAVIFAIWGVAVRAATRSAHAFADAADAPALEKALAGNRDAVGAEAARQRLVQIYIGEKKYPEAVKHLTLLSASGVKDEAIRSRARLDLAYVLELQGKNKEAAAAFAAIADDASCKMAVRLEGCCAAGRLMAAFDPDGALKVLQKGSSLTPDTPIAGQYQGEAKALLLALENGDLGAKPKAARKL